MKEWIIEELSGRDRVMIEECNAYNCYYGGLPLLAIKCPRVRKCECVAKAKWREGHWKVN